MSQDNLSTLCQRLLDAEAKYANLKTYWDNLPTDREYDLGLHVDWSWGSVGTGYKEMQFEIRRGLRQEFRNFASAALTQAMHEAESARNSILNYNLGENTNA